MPVRSVAPTVRYTLKKHTVHEYDIAARDGSPLRIVCIRHALGPWSGGEDVFTGRADSDSVALKPYTRLMTRPAPQRRPDSRCPTGARTAGAPAATGPAGSSTGPRREGRPLEEPRTAGSTPARSSCSTAPGLPSRMRRDGGPSMSRLPRVLARIGQSALLLTTAAVPLTGWALHAVALHRQLAATRRAPLIGLLAVALTPLAPGDWWPAMTWPWSWSTPTGSSGSTTSSGTRSETLSSPRSVPGSPPGRARAVESCGGPGPGLKERHPGRPAGTAYRLPSA